MSLLQDFENMLARSSKNGGSFTRQSLALAFGLSLMWVFGLFRLSERLIAAAKELVDGVSLIEVLLIAFGPFFFWVAPLLVYLRNKRIEARAAQKGRQ